MSDKIGKYEGMGYMIVAAVGLTPIVLDLGYIYAFSWLWPPKEPKPIESNQEKFPLVKLSFR